VNSYANSNNSATKDEEFADENDEEFAGSEQHPNSNQPYSEVE